MRKEPFRRAPSLSLATKLLSGMTYPARACVGEAFFAATAEQYCVVCPGRLVARWLRRGPVCPPLPPPTCCCSGQEAERQAPEGCGAPAGGANRDAQREGAGARNRHGGLASLCQGYMLTAPEKHLQAAPR